MPTSARRGPQGVPGTPGNVWRVGSAVPSNLLGLDGDMFLNKTVGDVYQRVAGVYVRVMTLGAGGGGGGGGVPTGTPPNLFIQQARPNPVGLLIDSLWIPLNLDGTQRPVAEWEVYTGLGDGNGQNLFIQVNPPVPVVDALWIPLNNDGTPKYLDDWVVYTGRGSIFGSGNSNLIISSVLPATPQVGSLFIPLGVGEIAKPVDQWRVYT